MHHIRIPDRLTVTSETGIPERKGCGVGFVFGSAFQIL
jgi:hypothetical protein